MISGFARSFPPLSMAANQVIDEIDSESKHLLRDLNQPWLHTTVCWCNSCHRSNIKLYLELHWWHNSPNISTKNTSKDSLQWPQKTTLSNVSVNYYHEQNYCKFNWASRGETSWCYDAENVRPYAHSMKFFLGTSIWNTLYIWWSSIRFKMVFTSTI